MPMHTKRVRSGVEKIANRARICTAAYGELARAPIVRLSCKRSALLFSATPQFVVLYQNLQEIFCKLAILVGQLTDGPV